MVATRQPTDYDPTLPRCDSLISYDTAKDAYLAGSMMRRMRIWPYSYEWVQNPQYIVHVYPCRFCPYYHLEREWHQRAQDARLSLPPGSHSPYPHPPKLDTHDDG